MEIIYLRQIPEKIFISLSCRLTGCVLASTTQWICISFWYRVVWTKMRNSAWHFSYLLIWHFPFTALCSTFLVRFTWFFSLIIFFLRAFSLTSGAGVCMRSSFIIIFALCALFSDILFNCVISLMLLPLVLPLSLAWLAVFRSISRPFTDLLFVFMHTLRWLECISNINK